jgi:hypothetical protein
MAGIAAGYLLRLLAWGDAMIPRSPAWRGAGADREASSPAQRLAALAREIARLAPNWQQPERFFEARSELAEEARKLARSLERN